jgi:hypothetical protein
MEEEEEARMIWDIVLILAILVIGVLLGASMQRDCGTFKD